MANKYRQSVNSAQTHFTKAPMGELEFSTWKNRVRNLTTFSAGEIVPIFNMEILPHDTISMDLDYVIRQATISVPTMDVLNVDFYAFFVPNRVVNKSWKNVMGENSSGAWSQDEPIVLAPLYTTSSSASPAPVVPVGSVADHYNFPTQQAIPNEIWEQMHDLLPRGYLEIYNTYFRDQNYQPPIPYSKLNIYNGFLRSPGDKISLNGYQLYHVPKDTEATGQYGAGAVVKELGGDGYTTPINWGLTTSTGAQSLARVTSWSFLDKPLKANKLHDYFTSVLPSPQKGRQVSVPLSGNLSLNTSSTVTNYDNPLLFNQESGSSAPVLYGSSPISSTSNNRNVVSFGLSANSETYSDLVNLGYVNGTNLIVENGGDASISLDDIRMSAGLQQVYEILGRGGSRYTEYINSFFGLDIDNPFDDIPTYLGHFRNELDLYQTAQTSATTDGVGTPQGNLSAFGYTSKSGKLFDYTFKEHGYLHIFCVVRQKNTYPSMLSRDKFRLNMMDFYQYPLANISEQPVYTREINPFTREIDDVFGYQEAWAEYRMIPDTVSGYLRPGIPQSLEYWTYADEFDSNLRIASGNFMQSNADEVVARTIAMQDMDLPQFKGQFFFNMKVERAMPTYSVAGLDII